MADHKGLAWMVEEIRAGREVDFARCDAIFYRLDELMTMKWEDYGLLRDKWREWKYEAIRGTR